MKASRERLNAMSRRQPGGCRIWTRHRTRSGYGQIGVDGQVLYAHRVSYVLSCGLIPHGMNVCHRCDNPSCIEPSHLFLSMQAGNMRDCAIKGRTTSPLTAAQVRDIRRRLANGEIQKSIAKRYGVSQAAVSLIKLRRKWRHV